MNTVRIAAATFVLLSVAPTVLAQDAGRQLTQHVGAASAPRLLDRSAQLTVTDVSLEAAIIALTKASGVPLAFSPGRLSARARASCACATVTVREALDRILAGTAMDYVELAGQVVLFPVQRDDRLEFEQPPRLATFASRVTGSLRSAMPIAWQEPVVAGVVVDAGTGQPLEGVQVTVRGSGRSAVTDVQGRFRITEVPAGDVTLEAQHIGFRASTQTVRAGTLDVRVLLERSPIPLDAVVVTGTAFPTRVRSLPNPISVLSAETIEAKQSANITDLLRGEIPSVLALSRGHNDYASLIFVRGNAAWTSRDVIKIYVDGVEIADPTSISTIDPRSIERIEVVRGPQASVIYGSEASSGVMQIFTKKGGITGLDRPVIDVQTALGVIETAYAPDRAGRPLTQDHSVQARGGNADFSYRVGAGYATTGEWLTGYGSRTLAGSAGLRATQGPFSAELTALWSDRSFDQATSPVYWTLPAGPACRFCGNPDFNFNEHLAMSQSTIGINIGYQATPRWQHTLVLGNDDNRFAQRQTEPTRLTPADTFVYMFTTSNRRRSARYHTAFEPDIGEAMSARFSAGADYWAYDTQGGLGFDLLSTFGPVRSGQSSFTSLTNDGWWNAGYFGMAEIGFREQLYLTFAGRLESNPRLGDDYGHAFSPRVGASWVRNVAGLDFKVRGQLGKGVRPPPDAARSGGATATIVTFPNPAIGPEEKVGWDAGVEVYGWNGRGMIGVTRYVEEGRNLIQLVDIDAAATPRTRQYRNIGRVTSDGWEVEGKVELHPITLQANYAYSDNVIRELSNTFEPTPDQTYWVGDRMLYVPTHSGGGAITARVLRGSIGINASMMKDWRALDYFAWFGRLYGGDTPLPSQRDYYINYSDPLWKWHLRADQLLGNGITAFLRVENVTNNQEADFFNFNVTPGRTTVFGVRYSH